MNTSTTPKVQYAYSEMTGGANHSRLTQMVYPQGATVNYSYGSGIDSAISRITSAEMLSTGNATLSSESYSYLGLGQVVVKSTPVATLSYIQATGDTAANTDAGDKYTGLDRFGRVIDQVWRSVAGSGTIMDRYQYGYDRAGNRLFKNNLLDTALSELYSYGNLNQLTSFSRGVLSDANSDGLFDTVASSSRTQAWNLDALGNWANLTTNSTSQSRTHNAQNQVTGVGSTSLSYDANGSMTADESSRVFVYDAWNRLAAVRNTANSPIVGYSYDALGRRIIEDRPNANTVDHLYYSTGWQVLEERGGGIADSNIRRQYFWSVDYVDALTARVDYASGAVSATYYAQYDANWNVTAIADASYGLLERYIYDPYGAATVLYSNWTVRGGSPYGWNYLHQGGRLDVDSNLYHFRHRDYSATLGRWTQTDPIGFEAGDKNFYQYVGNSPGNLVDPSGLFGISETFWSIIENPWVQRGFGGIQVIAGGAEVAAGTAVGWTPIGVLIMAHGVDNVVAGGRTVYYGQGCQSATEGTISVSLQQVGVPDWYADFGAGFGNGIITGRVIGGAPKAPPAKVLPTPKAQPALPPPKAKPMLPGPTPLKQITGIVLRSFDDLAANPRCLYGMGPEDAGKILGDGWKLGDYGQTGVGWAYRDGRGGIVYFHDKGRHVGPYWGYKSAKTGKVKIVSPEYVPLPGDKATIIYY